MSPCECPLLAQTDLAGDAIKVTSLVGGAASVVAGTAGAATGQVEVVLPAVLGLRRSAQGYELGAGVSSIGVLIKSAASGSPTGYIPDQLNDRIAEGIGLKGFSKGLFNDALGSLEDVKYACGAH